MNAIFDFFKTISSARIQKFALNIMLFLIISFIEGGILFLNYRIYYGNEHGGIYVKIAAIIILGWLGIMLGFYAWAIYFYNINFGLTNEDWEKIKQNKADAERMKALDLEHLSPPVESPLQNPYKDETFGLPPGTVRATIAITILISGLSMLLVSFDESAINHIAVHEKYLDFLKNAFLMMIAFYFGSQSLKFLQSPSSTTTTTTEDTSTSGNKNTGTTTSSIKTTTTIEEPVVTKDKDNINAEPTATTVIKKIDPALADSSTEYDDNDPHHIKMASIKNSKQKITPEDILAVSKELGGLEPALISAVLTVESSGGGFLADGRPKILFEGHVFWKNLKKAGIDPQQYAVEFPDIVYEKWTKQYYSKSSANEYLRLDKAIRIDRDSALKSASWGLFQILGDNFKAAGFDSVVAFVEAQKESEYKQLLSFMNFIKNENLIQYLEKRDWRGFAKRYNGPGYELNKYHLKLEEAYAKEMRKQSPSYKASLKRTSQDNTETLGELTIENSGRIIFTCKTLELAWKDNQRNISCIPPGSYTVQKRFSEAHKQHFHVMDVKDRDWILIHSGNYYSDIRGCILVGLKHVDINKDGVLDVSNSRDTLNKLVQILPDQFQLEIS